MKCTECKDELTMGEEEYYKNSIRPRFKLPVKCYHCGELERQSKRLKVKKDV